MRHNSNACEVFSRCRLFTQPRAVAGMGMGFDGAFWKEAVIVDPWPLSVLSLTLCFCLLFRWFYSPERRQYLHLAVFVYGVTLTCSHRCSRSLHWQRTQNALYPAAQGSGRRVASLAAGTQRPTCRCRVHKCSRPTFEPGRHPIHPDSALRKSASKVSITENQTCVSTRLTPQHRDESFATWRGPFGNRDVART